MRDKPGIHKIELYYIKQFIIKSLYVSSERRKTSEFWFGQMRLNEEHGLWMDLEGWLWGKYREARKAFQTTDSGLKAQKREWAWFVYTAVRGLTLGGQWCIWGIMTKSESESWFWSALRTWNRSLDLFSSMKSEASEACSFFLSHSSLPLCLPRKRFYTDWIERRLILQQNTKQVDYFHF